MSTILKIADWDDLYENSRTREMKRMQWVPVPCKFDGDGYTELVSGHKNGAAHYAAWMALLLCAGRCEHRGTLTRSGGRPHDSTSISAMTKIPKSLIDEALPRLIGIGWIVADLVDGLASDCGQTAVNPQVNCGQTAGTRTGARASVPFYSVPFFPRKGMQGEGNELPQILDTDEFRKSLDAWMAYKTEKREAYKPTGFRSMLTHAANMAKVHGLPAIINAMTRAMANGWKGWDQDSTFNAGAKNGKSTSRSYQPNPGQEFVEP